MGRQRVGFPEGRVEASTQDGKEPSAGPSPAYAENPLAPPRGGAGAGPRRGPRAPRGGPADPIGEAALDPARRERAARFLYICADAVERVARLVAGLKLREPAVGDLGD